MQFQAENKITIDAPASEVWRILAHEYDSIGQWSSGIAISLRNVEGAIPTGASCSGRVCVPANQSMGIKEVKEVFTHYDDKAMSFTYEATVLPSFMESAKNTWSVHPLGDGRSQAEFNANVKMNFFPGFFLKPVFKMLGGRTLAELKYYIEEGKPHPRKVKASKKSK